MSQPASASQQTTTAPATDMKTFQFGPWPIRSSEIFFATPLSFGLVNLKPVVPLFHKLYRPQLTLCLAMLLLSACTFGSAVGSDRTYTIQRTIVARFNDLSQEEAADLFMSAQSISKVIEKEFKADAMTITIQDGPAAGQTVPHVHIHVIPRHVGDWLSNDDIYPEINRKEAQLGHEIFKSVGDHTSADAVHRRAFRPMIVSELPTSSQSGSAAAENTDCNGTQEQDIVIVRTTKPKGADNHERAPRTREEMAAESAILRRLFAQKDDIWSKM